MLDPTPHVISCFIFSRLTCGFGGINRPAKGAASLKLRLPLTAPCPPRFAPPTTPCASWGLYSLLPLPSPCAGPSRLQPLPTGHVTPRPWAGGRALQGEGAGAPPHPGAAWLTCRSPTRSRRSRSSPYPRPRRRRKPGGAPGAETSLPGATGRRPPAGVRQPVSLLLALTKCHRSPPTHGKVDALPTVVRGRGPRLRDGTSEGAGTLTPSLAPCGPSGGPSAPAEVRLAWSPPVRAGRRSARLISPRHPCGVTGQAPAYPLRPGSAPHEPPGRTSLAPHRRSRTSTRPAAQARGVRVRGAGRTTNLARGALRAEGSRPSMGGFAKVPGRPGCVRVEWPPWWRFPPHSLHPARRMAGLIASRSPVREY